MNFSIVYLTQRFFYRIFDFLRAWYIGSFFFIARQILSFLEQMDKIFAVRITLRNIFEPLYQDHTIVGHVLGFIFRSLRIVLGSIVYIFVVSLFIVIYLAWILVPIFIIYRGFF
jgi:hypothetical protein